MLSELGESSGEFAVAATGAGFGSGAGGTCSVCTVGKFPVVCGAIGVEKTGLAGRGVGGLY